MDALLRSESFVSEISSGSSHGHYEGNLDETRHRAAENENDETDTDSEKTWSDSLVLLPEVLGVIKTILGVESQSGDDEVQQYKQLGEHRFHYRFRTNFRIENFFYRKL
jgi:hypothetical protein